MSELPAERQAWLERLLRERLRENDPDVKIHTSVRPDGKVDITVVSRLFDGLDSRERESIFWPVFEPVPKSELIHLTYCLLLTPEEARRDFSGVPASFSSKAENWEE